jgi:hypothetical protein
MGALADLTDVRNIHRREALNCLSTSVDKRHCRRTTFRSVIELQAVCLESLR